MSVASANPFALLAEEASPPDSPDPATQKKEASASQPARGAAKSKGPASRGGRYYSRGGKPRDPTQDGQEEAPAGDERAAKKADGEGRGRGRGRGRGDRGGRGRGRTFDRHSATGKTDSDKKIHQGWGGDEGGDELKAEEAGTTDAQAEGAAAATDGWDPVPIDSWSQPPPADPWGAPPAADDTAPVAEGEKGDDDRKPRDRDLEEEDNTISYEQYLAQLKDNTTPAIPKLEGIREANEGDEEAWGDVVEHKKNEGDEAYYVGKTKATTKARAEKKEKVFIEIEAHFDRPGRGGRGRGRGGERGRGRGRGSRGHQSNGTPVDINVDDKNAFPTLS